ncbi:DUF1684 domain-containing protein [Saccharomonospora sp. NPDC046836]|uniref:DUF1684 domain-containing protein n=1 Tax=Saccharomonospora sp. NPDC046836 TaxID=3156921 RepID=UPI0033C4C3BD
MTTTLGGGLVGEWVSWHAEREQELREPYGWLSLAGLHWLGEQAQTFDGIPGAWSASTRAARVTATAEEGLVVEDRLLDGSMQLTIHESGSALFGAHGSVRLELLRRGGAYGIRARDPRSPVLTSFTGVPAFPVHSRWMVPATFELYSPPHVQLTGTAQPGLRRRLEIVGELRFTVAGTEYTLAATAGAGSSLIVPFSDTSSGSTTAPWRVLAVRRPRLGRTVLDFNRALNPPSAFTAYGTCPQPPGGNTLPFAVEAGERAPG